MKFHDLITYSQTDTGASCFGAAFIEFLFHKGQFVLRYTGTVIPDPDQNIAVVHPHGRFDTFALAAMLGSVIQYIQKDLTQTLGIAGDFRNVIVIFLVIQSNAFTGQSAAVHIDRIFKFTANISSFHIQSETAVLNSGKVQQLDGFEVCRRIRATSKRIGIIMLTARTQEMDKVTGLMNGADDYVTKPFSTAELTARLDALVRRVRGDSAAVSELLTQGPFVMNTRNRTLEKNGNRIRLTQVEYSIVKLFMQNPGRALSREEILSAVWGREYEGDLKIVDVNIRRLRIKLEDNPNLPVYITTVWGYGYKWGS